MEAAGYFCRAGGSFLDTANVYAAWIPGGEGASERTIGGWLKNRAMGGRVVVGAKGGRPSMEAVHLSRLSSAEITHDLFQSQK